MTTTAATTTTTSTLDLAIATVTAWLRARAHMTALELAHAAGVRLRLLGSIADDGVPSFLHTGPLDAGIFDGVQSVGVACERFAPESPAVRRAFLEGLAAVLVERETGQRIGRSGAHRIVAGLVELPQPPHASEARWWREQFAAVEARRTSRSSGTPVRARAA
jgi:hypothetical protein